MRKLAKLTSILLVSVFFGMQFVPTRGTSKTSTARTHTAEMINPQVGKILDRSCQDCHSNRTAWPWYSHVAPGLFPSTLTRAAKCWISPNG
jgi:hypothetical protein